MVNTTSLNSNRDFKRLYSRGLSVVGSSMVLYVRPTRRSGNRLGLTVSTKLGGAVRRNRMRRRLKECFRGLEGSVQGTFDIVIVARSRCFDIPFPSLNAEMLSLFGKAKMSQTGKPV